MNINDTPTHDQDLYGWAMHTANLLKEGRLEEIDFENILEEMEALGRSEKSELRNRLAQTICHLLKWQFQPSMRGHSWFYTLREQRQEALFHLQSNPSLKSAKAGILEEAYIIGVSKAARQSGLDEKTFPKECPYTFEQVMDHKYYPS